MAKLAYSKLKLAVKDEVKEITFNEQQIEVKQYLPMAEKTELVQTAINNIITADTNLYRNAIKEKLFINLEIIRAYTNITFTDKQLEDLNKLYDQWISSGAYYAVLEAIPSAELKEILEIIEFNLAAWYNFKTSAVGLVDTISNNYSELDLNATEIQKKLADPENVGLLKGILKNLG